MKLFAGVIYYPWDIVTMFFLGGFKREIYFVIFNESKFDLLRYSFR